MHEKWTLGPELCRIFPFFFYGNVAASLMNMVAITVNRWVLNFDAIWYAKASSPPSPKYDLFRYVLITYHGSYHQIYSRVNILLMVTLVWAFSFGMILPPLIEVMIFQIFQMYNFSLHDISNRPNNVLSRCGGPWAWTARPSLAQSWRRMESLRRSSFSSSASSSHASPSSSVTRPSSTGFARAGKSLVWY